MSRLGDFDTDVLIDASRESEDAVRALERAEQESSLAVSAVTEMERAACGGLPIGNA